MKKQVVVIHGGDTFGTYEEYQKFLKSFQIDFDKYRSNKKDWKTTLYEYLGSEYEVIAPEMPNKRNAVYEEWKIWFEKFTPFLEEESILIGHSLGGAFLAKYLSENKFPVRLKAVFLIAAVYDNDIEGYPLVSFSLPAKLNLQTDRIYIYHSHDDKIVPFGSLQMFHKQLPNAQIRVFKDRGHFNQESLPELIADIKSL